MSRTKVELRVAHAAWRTALPELRRRAVRAVEAALAVAEPASGGPAGELALILTDDAAMRALNRAWRGKDKSTNVLAFAAQERAGGAWATAGAGPQPRLLGDVVLAYGTVVREAEAGGLTFSDHMSHLIVHGVLHLFGYDHQRPRQARVMETLEARALATLDIANPYEAPPYKVRTTRTRRAMER